MLFGAMRKQPLFEKSGAKTFFDFWPEALRGPGQINKVFLLLFVHKK
jgi:hypothetical protein